MSSLSDLSICETPPVAAQETLLSLDQISKSYRLWNRPYDRLFYGIWNQVPGYAPDLIRRLANRQKAGLGKEVFALAEVTLSIRKGESVGIIGRNGSGKSTLLQLIAGVLQPTSGRIRVDAKRVTALLELGSGFDPNFTGRQNVLLHGSLLGLTEEENHARLSEVLDFSEIGDYFDRPVKTYSSGMIVRLAFASSITVRADLLIVDEALAVGDIFFQQKCFHKIRELVKAGVTILLVSHDLRSISEFCDETLLLDHGRVIFFGDSNVAIDRYYGMTKSFILAAPGGARKQAPASSLSSVEEPPPVLMESIPRPKVVPYEDAVATFLHFALLNHEGKPTNLFRQGEWLTLLFDVEVLADVENLSAGVVFRDDRRTFLHSKYEFQTDLRSLRIGKKGDHFRVSYEVRLDVAPGHYTLSLDLISVPAEAIAGGKLAFLDYERHFRRVCHAGDLVAITVGFNPSREGAEFSHLGLFDLPTRFD